MAIMNRRAVGYLSFLLAAAAAMGCGSDKSSSNSAMSVKSSGATLQATSANSTGATLQATSAAPKDSGAPKVDQKKTPDEIPKPQSPDYYGYRLKEIGTYFYGTVDSNGVVGQTWSKAGDRLAPGNAQSKPDGRGQNHAITFDHDTTQVDPCTQGKFNLPLYVVKEAEKPLCEDIYPATDAEKRECPNVDTGAFQRHAIAIPGHWDNAGKYTTEKVPVNGRSLDTFTFACVTGTAAKCVHWGYPPWKAYKDGKYVDAGTPGSTSLSNYYVACVHAARADYKADGGFETCNATLVDMFDNLGIQKCDPTWVTDAGAPSLESVWKTNGALACMRRHRYQGCNGDGGVEDANCDRAFDLNKCNANWPAGSILRVISEHKGHPSGVCPRTDAICSER